MSNAADIAEMRKQGVQRRLAVDESDRKRAAQRVCEIASQLEVWRSAASIAAYLPERGEIDPMRLLARAHKQGKRCYVPVLEGRSMRFKPWTPGAAMRKNIYGISEPIDGQPLTGRAMDLVFAPLVAFDNAGNRLGMGGGFYDRAFAYRSSNEAGALLVGLAFEVQRLGALRAMPWDVPLDAVLTERRWVNFRGQAEPKPKEMS